MRQPLQMAKLAAEMTELRTKKLDSKLDETQKDVPSRTRKPTQKLTQMTVKLDTPTRNWLMQESLRRKGKKSPNWPIQNIITEAITEYRKKA